MRPPLVAAALPLLLIAFVVQVGPCAGLPARAVSGRPRHRSDDLISGTDFLSVFIGSALPRSASSSSQQAPRTKSRDSTTAPEDIGFGARLAPKSSSTTTSTASTAPTALSTNTENPLSRLVTASLSTRRQEYESTYSSPLTDSYSEAIHSSTEPNVRIDDSASELKYRTFPPPDSNTDSQVSLSPDSSISVVTEIVTSKQELISLTAGDPSDGDQHASDGVLSASRITSFYVQQQDDNQRKDTGYQSPSTNTDYQDILSQQTAKNDGYHGSVSHNSRSDSNVHYKVTTDHGSGVASHYHSSPGPSPSYHSVTVYEERQGRDYQGHSTLPSSSSWFSSQPTEATHIIVNHPGQPTSRPESSTVQQVISVRVSSSVVQGPSSPPHTARSKPFSSSQGSNNQFYNSGESTGHDDSSAGHSRSETDTARSYLQHSLSQSTDNSHEQAVEDQQQVVPTSLVTEDQPAATAVQRSQFSVEESSPSDVSSLHGQQRHHTGHSYRDDDSDQTIATVVEVPSSAINYETRVSSPTSNSRVQFYSGPPPNQPEPVRRHGTWTPRNRKSFGQQEQQQDQQQQHHHSEQHPPQQHQHGHAELAERNYEQPEQNYEVDEQLSVVTNGRAHGIQLQEDGSHTTEPSTAAAPLPEHPQVDSAGNKAGYVVEGRGFRKYRVEERTADGFIVGEYGVVNSEGDPLRAVRYTADGTAPTKLIDQALSHFLSL